MFIFKKLFRDIISYKDFLYYYTLYEIKANSARSMLGFIWWVIDPFLYMSIYYLLVQVILQRGGPDYGIFLFVALIPIKWTISTLTNATTAITSRASILRQIYIPKVVLVLLSIFSNFTKFLMGLAAVFIFLFIYNVPLSLHIISLIIIISVHLIFLVAISLIFSHIGVYFRDLRNMMRYSTRIIIYLSPVLYTVESVPESIRELLYLNPLTTLIISYRNVLLYQEQPQWIGLFTIFCISIVLLYLGLKILFKYDKHYAKVV